MNSTETNITSNTDNCEIELIGRLKYNLTNCLDDNQLESLQIYPIKLCKWYLYCSRVLENIELSSRKDFIQELNDLSQSIIEDHNSYDFDYVIKIRTDIEERAKVHHNVIYFYSDYVFYVLAGITRMLVQNLPQFFNYMQSYSIVPSIIVDNNILSEVQLRKKLIEILLEDN